MISKKNILFISKWFSVAGTETFMMNVLRNINKQQFHIDFLLFSESTSAYSEEAERLGSKIHRLPARNTGLRYYRSLDEFFKKNAGQYNAIHFCGGNLSSIAPIYYAYKYKIPIRIIHSHSSDSQGMVNKILHLINRRFIPLLGTCSLACSSLAAKYFFGKKECAIIKNGVDTNKYKFNEERRILFREKYDISPSTHVLGHIGRFDEVKNQMFLVDIFFEYKKKYSDAKLLLVGTGILEDQVKRKVKDRGIVDDVLFLGVRNDIPDILCAMDCFVMPSLFEGLPFVLVEAQTSGLPCVISNTINKDSKLTPYLRFRGLNDDLELWLEDIRGLIGKNNREEGVNYTDEQGFNIRTTVQYLENLYDK